MTVYQTSSLTFIYKYIFVPAWTFMLFFQGIFVWSSGDKEAELFAAHIILIGGSALLWFIPMMLRLRRAEANEHHLLIKKINGTQIINYTDIEYVSQPVMINPKLISIRYIDRESGTSKNILLMPSRSENAFNFDMLEETGMTRFIRQQILKFNPNFTRDTEPSRWKLAGIVMGSVLVLMLILFLLIPGGL